jgi:hypothetical protein
MTAGIARWTVVPLALALLLGLRLAADGRLSGDEPAHLYSAAYQPVAWTLAGDVEPSGIPGFMQGRPLHVVFLKGVMVMTGAGPEGLRVLQVMHTVIVALNLMLIGAIARRLLPDVAKTHAAVLLLAMTPIILYFALKTTADNEALLAALIATWGLLRIARDRGAAGPFAVVFGLTVAVLAKNQMVFMPAAFWLAGCLLPVAGMDRRRLAMQGAAWGIAAAIVTATLLEASGIGLANYLASYSAPFANRTPPVAKIVNLGTELGLIWLLIPVALLTHRRRELGLFSLWFAAAMTPFLFLSGVEPRHVAVNLAAAGGLVSLALEAIQRRVPAWSGLGDTAKGVLATVAVIAVMAVHAVALAIMPHKVDLHALGDALSALDSHYGEDGYTLVASNGYADFLIVRVLWPERDVLNAGTAEYAIDTAGATRQAQLEAYLGDRYVRDLQGLAQIRKPAVFFGFRRTFAAANLDRMLSAVSPALAARVLSGVPLAEHLYAGYSAWLWDNPEVRLEPILDSGNYQALEIKLLHPGE